MTVQADYWLWTGTFHSTTQEPVFAQAQSSDHASMPMNTTTLQDQKYILSEKGYQFYYA
jgi:hypothetical protein